VFWLYRFDFRARRDHESKQLAFVLPVLKCGCNIAACPLLLYASYFTIIIIHFRYSETIIGCRILRSGLKFWETTSPKLITRTTKTIIGRAKCRRCVAGCALVALELLLLMMPPQVSETRQRSILAQPRLRLSAKRSLQRLSLCNAEWIRFDSIHSPDRYSLAGLVTPSLPAELL